MAVAQLTDRRGGRTGTLARHRARIAIQNWILSGELQPGQQLIQQDLAQRLGVAQSVIREALLELQFCGLVEGVDNLGMFVSGLDARMLLSAYEIREVFEGLAARLCCERASLADTRELSELARRVYELAGENQLEAMGEADQHFHLRMVQMSGNELLAKLTESYQVLGMFVRANRPGRKVYDEHSAIVKAIEANQPEEVERLARHHAQAARQTIKDQISRGEFVLHCVAPAAVDETDSETNKHSRVRRKIRKKDKVK